MTDNTTSPPKKGLFGRMLDSMLEAILVIALLILFAIFPKLLELLGWLVNGLGIPWLHIEPDAGRALDITAYIHTFLSKAAQLTAANLLIWILFSFFYPTIAGYIRYDNADPAKPKFREDFGKLTPLARILIFLGLLAFQLVYLTLL